MSDLHQSVFQSTAAPAAKVALVFGSSSDETTLMTLLRTRQSVLLNGKLCGIDHGLFEYLYSGAALS